MATLYSKNQARQQSAFLSEWTNFTRPALTAMVQAGLDLVSAMDTYRGGQLSKVDSDRHDSSAVDRLAGLLDHLSDEHGAALRAGNELGIAPDMIELDVAELEAAYNRRRLVYQARELRLDPFWRPRRRSHVRQFSGSVRAQATLIKCRAGEC
jgi:hypothetical protein